MPKTLTTFCYMLIVNYLNFYLTSCSQKKMTQSIHLRYWHILLQLKQLALHCWTKCMTIFFPIVDQSSVENLQSEINTLSTRFNRWQLSVNINKSSYLYLSNKNKNHAVVQYSINIPFGKKQCKRSRNFRKRQLEYVS